LKEALEECGFVYYLILARLYDIDPHLNSKDGKFFFTAADFFDNCCAEISAPTFAVPSDTTPHLRST
jgi:hypothetical protein